MPDSTFPTTVDTFTNPDHSLGDTLQSVPHDLQHRKANDALLAIEKRLFESVFNVFEYGAVGNGTTDDKAAIQAAIDAANTAGGGTVLLPAGNTFKLAGLLTDYSSLLTMKSNVRLSGYGATLLATEADDSGYYGGIIGIGTRAGAAPTNVVVEGVTVDGNYTGSSLNEDVFGITVYFGTDILIQHNVVKNIQGDGISAGPLTSAGTTARRVAIRNNNVHSCTGQAIAVNGNATTPAKEFVISGNYCHDTTSSATGAAETMILSPNIQDFVVSGNVCAEWGTIAVYHGTRVQIANNIVKPLNNAESCVTIDISGTTGSTQVSVTDNLLDASANTADSWGVFVHASTTSCIEISGNIIRRRNGNKAGIHVPNTSSTLSGLVIANNVITGGSASGNNEPDINVSGTAQNSQVVISGNVCRSATSSVFCEASNGSVTGNYSVNGGMMCAGSGLAVSGNRITQTVALYGYGYNNAFMAVSLNESVVSGNFFESTVDQPLRVHGPCSNNLFSQNKLKKGGSQHIVENNSGGALSGNHYLDNQTDGAPSISYVGSSNSCALYIDSGALKYRGSSATVTTIANA